MNIKREKRPPLWIVLMTLISVFGGIILAIMGINKIENYYHPYLFGLIFGGLGLLIGLLTAKKLKPIIAVNQRMKNDYYLPTLFISIGFFGLFLMSASIINLKLSKVDYHDNFIVENKYRQEYRYMQPEINSIVVQMNGDSRRLVCSYDFWIRTSVGQTVYLTNYKSKLGFDFIKISNDKK
ncbi:MAG: hypothetical protein AB7S69_13040 [Salinivirgaceae bacterium]